jgi:hypothetical protein
MEEIRVREVPISNREAVAGGAPRANKAFAFPNISWGAIFSGLTVGVATQVLLTLFGVAAGLSAVDPRSAEPVGQVPMMVGIWNGISMLISAFVGGYVAARASGLTRRVDGLLHGFVAWGATTLLFTYLATTAVGSVVGGAFSALGGGVKAAAQTAASAASNQSNAGQGQDLGSRLQSIITGGAGSSSSAAASGSSGNAGGINAQQLQQLQQSLRSGDRAGANDILVNQMGLSQERADQVIGQIEPLVRNGPERARQVADQTVSTAAAGSWWLSFGILLSMLVGLLGGASGARSASHRRSGSSHAVAA